MDNFNKDDDYLIVVFIIGFCKTTFQIKVILRLKSK
nr:MAG TPA: hypothetical protein [Caudoviricetes sp.]